MFCIKTMTGQAMISKDARWILRSQHCLRQKKNGLTSKKSSLLLSTAFLFMTECMEVQGMPHK